MTSLETIYNGLTPVCAQRRAGGMREADAEVGRGR